MSTYNPHEIEKKWQLIWEKEEVGASDSSDKPKFYNLMEFPYPSGYGLHVGHCMGYTASDVYSRVKRMQGYNVLFPMGWDAFGLPTENFAIKTGRKPAEVTKENTDMFRKQMKALAYSFDWKREIDTTDPSYYKWTQWIFLQFYKHAYINGKVVEVNDDDTTTPRLAYQAEMPINWCPSCKIGLANEEVIDGKCERCGAETYKKMQKQWMLRITAYADRLIDDLAKTDYLEKIKTQQINWIGRSTGSNIKFKIKDTDFFIEVFTTRADTLFGCTYVVLAPENAIVANLKTKTANEKEIDEYVDNAKKKSDLERTELQKEKTGVRLEGIKAINPINGDQVDVWVADYVLANYGTGAVMAVPAHDERDWEFAKKYEIAIKDVVVPCEGEKHEKEEFRKSVSAVVHRKNDNKFLLIDWKKFGWISFPLGGVNDGESIEEAVAREVLEETGYKVRPVEKLGGIIESHYFAENKKVWRSRHDQPFLCELISDEPTEVDEEEKKLHGAVWMSANEALAKVTHSYNKISLIRYLKKNYAYTDYGCLIDSAEFSGMESQMAKEKITEKLKMIGSGDFQINFKLRDWVFSRQHYWGEPIPIVHCKKCGMVPLDEKDLPLTLPEVDKYEPSDTGESPLAAIIDWVNVKCPKCGGEAKRETDTMPNWAGSSWYFLRYTDPRNDKEFASQDKLKYWMPVDLYNGGMEHTTLHLLYSRFWHKFLYDLGEVPTAEPYQKRIAHGIILGPDGRKMSKSFGNVINPDDIVKKYGADAMRTYIMFIGPYDQESAWSTAGLQGVYRFLHKVWRNSEKINAECPENIELKRKYNKYIDAITDDLENFRLNTYVAKLMEMNNEIDKVKEISKDLFEIFLKLLAPASPHIAEELWHNLGNKESIFGQVWQKADKKYITDEHVVIGVQINGKLRGTLKVAAAATEDEVMDIVKKEATIGKWINNSKLLKVIYKPGKIISLVVSE